MKSLADALPADIARQVHPDWRKNETAYWRVRDQLLDQYQGRWIGFADGAVIASGTSPVAVFHAAEATGRNLFVTCVGREDEPTRRATFGLFSTGREYPCRLHADFVGRERILGRDVLNRFEALFRWPAGEVVIKQGDEGDYFYAIVNGKCVVTRETPLNKEGIKLAELGVGSPPLPRHRARFLVRPRTEARGVEHAAPRATRHRRLEAQRPDRRLRERNAAEHVNAVFDATLDPTSGGLDDGLHAHLPSGRPQSIRRDEIGDSHLIHETGDCHPSESAH